MITVDYGMLHWLWVVTGYEWLRVVTGRYEWLQVVKGVMGIMGGYGWRGGQCHQDLLIY